MEMNYTYTWGSCSYYRRVMNALTMFFYIFITAPRRVCNEKNVWMNMYHSVCAWSEAGTDT